jgi:hypothetical protein
MVVVNTNSQFLWRTQERQEEKDCFQKELKANHTENRAKKKILWSKKLVISYMVVLPHNKSNSIRNQHLSPAGQGTILWAEPLCGFSPLIVTTHKTKEDLFPRRLLCEII